MFCDNTDWPTLLVLSMTISDTRPERQGAFETRLFRLGVSSRLGVFETRQYLREQNTYPWELRRSSRRLPRVVSAPLMLALGDALRSPRRVSTVGVIRRTTVGNPPSPFLGGGGRSSVPELQSCLGVWVENKSLSPQKSEWKFGENAG